ncbi:LytR C-terminal domain-containing protein [Candidatus Daviesbacteria bacterium]|nr:LytR C-terminal domain-containing protein [Candidatus Daviesbacteria bacterium]
MWKKDQKERPFNREKRARQNLKLALIVLLALGLLLTLGKVFQFFSEFQKPFYVLNTKPREFSWDGSSVLNLVVARFQKRPDGVELEDFNFVSLNGEEGKITILKLSDEILLELPKNFGSWKLGSIYKLGQENKPPMGEDLLKMSVSKMLALPIDGIIEVDSDQPLDIESEVNLWKSNLLTGFGFLTKIRTDLSLKESMDFINKAAKIRSDKITSLDLFRSTITQSKLLPDSSRVLGVDGVKLDTFTKQNLIDPVISGEDLTVAVYNGTDHAGLTSEAVRLINNLGARVTIITNTSGKFVKNGVFINQSEGGEAKTSRTYKRLTEIFALNCLKEECKTADSEVLNSRAAISVVLGEEYFNYWSSR